MPRYVRFVTPWPMSATKIRQVTVREQMVSEIASE